MLVCKKWWAARPPTLRGNPIPLLHKRLPPGVFVLLDCGEGSMMLIRWWRNRIELYRRLVVPFWSGAICCLRSLLNPDADFGG